jgi:hypothetical protein
MNIPLSGIILLPCSLVVFFFAPARLGEWAILISIFQAAAIVNLRSGFAFGLAPFFLVALMVAARVIPQWLSGNVRFFRNEPALLHVRLMAVFIGWTVFSAFALPILFAGTPVDDPRKGIDQSYYLQMPLHLSFSNAGQAAYMLLNFFLLMHMVQMSEQPEYFERIAHAFSLSGLLVVAVGTYQIVCFHAGLSFPTWIFNSNTAWAQLSNQYFDGITRLTATFTEPSSAACFLSAWSLFELTLLIGGKRSNGRHLFCVIAGTMALVETASTTGYITVGVMWTIIVINTLKTVLIRGRLNGRAMVAIGLAVVGATVTFAAVPDAHLLLNGVLFRKASSKSAIHRMATLGRAVGVFEGTLGLGAGLGSNRASSLFFYVLSNVGTPGILMLLWLLAQVWFEYSKYSRRQLNSPVRTFIRASGAAFTANLLAMAFGGAEISTPYVWILWGMLLVGLRRAWLVENATDEIIDLQPSNAISAELSTVEAM